MDVAGQVDDADDVPILSGLLHQRQKMGSQDDMAHVVHSHVPVDAVLSELIGHDTPSGVVDQDIQAISRILDLLSHILHLLPIAQVTVQPLGLVSSSLTHFFGNRRLGAINHFFGGGQDEDVGDVVLQKGVGDAVADTLTAAGDDGDFSREIRDIVEGELMGG